MKHKFAQLIEKKNSESENREYMVVSGHRRYKACKSHTQGLDDIMEQEKEKN